MNLASVDLNLLVYLDALLSEGHVTNAGKQVGLSQSAMSRALSRLRDLFDDELLIKTAHGMVLSPRAEALAPEVRHLLRQIERALDPDLAFDPSAEQRTFQIALSAVAARRFGAALLAALRQRAPGVRCAFKPMPEAFPLSALKRGELDVALCSALTLPTTHRAHELSRQALVTVLPRDLEPPRSAREWAELPHALCHLAGDDFDAGEPILSQLGLKRRVVAHLSDLALARAAVDEARCCVTLPLELATAQFAKERLSTPPIELPEALDLLHWSPHLERDPANRWLRETIREVASTLT